MHSKNQLSDQFELHLFILFSKLYFFKLLWGGHFLNIFLRTFENHCIHRILNISINGDF